MVEKRNITIKYRCKLCGTAFEKHTLLLPSTEEIDVEGTITNIAMKCYNLPHYCNDGRIGIASPYEIERK